MVRQRGILGHGHLDPNRFALHLAVAGLGREQCTGPPAGREPSFGGSAMPMQVPRYPPLTWKTWRNHGRGEVGSILDAQSVALTTSGRMATALTLRHIGVRAGDEVLIPAYHCPTMVHPVHWTGATPRFYKLRGDLSVDTEDLSRKINGRTRVVIAAHFFGFPSDLRALRVQCDVFGLSLIEDCAHAPFGGTRSMPVGSIGDYATGSLMKFYPIVDGGCVASWRHRLDGLKLRSGGRGFEARAWVDSLERSIHFGRLPGLSVPVKALSLARDAVKVAVSKGRPDQLASTEDRKSPPATWGDFDPSRVGTRMSAFSRLVVRCSSEGHQIARRRAIYGRMLEAFSDLPNCRIVQGHLPDGVVPYAFPLWLDAPDGPYSQMQEAGLPVMRWDELSTFVGDPACEVSANCARRLIQIPCHQELTVSELERLIGGVRAAVTGQGRQERACSRRVGQ